MADILNLLPDCPAMLSDDPTTYEQDLANAKANLATLHSIAAPSFFDEVVGKVTYEGAWNLVDRALELGFVRTSFASFVLESSFTDLNMVEQQHRDNACRYWAGQIETINAEIPLEQRQPFVYPEAARKYMAELEYNNQIISARYDKLNSYNNGLYNLIYPNIYHTFTNPVTPQLKQSAISNGVSNLKQVLASAKPAHH